MKKHIETVLHSSNLGTKTLSLVSDMTKVALVLEINTRGGSGGDDGSYQVMTLTDKQTEQLALALMSHVVLPKKRRKIENQNRKLKKELGI